MGRVWMEEEEEPGRFECGVFIAVLLEVLVFLAVVFIFKLY